MDICDSLFQVSGVVFTELTLYLLVWKIAKDFLRLLQDAPSAKPGRVAWPKDEKVRARLGVRFDWGVVIERRRTLVLQPAAEVKNKALARIALHSRAIYTIKIPTDICGDKGLERRTRWAFLKELKEAFGAYEHDNRPEHPQSRIV